MNLCSLRLRSKFTWTVSNRLFVSFIILNLLMAYGQVSRMPYRRRTYVRRLAPYRALSARRVRRYTAPRRRTPVPRSLTVAQNIPAIQRMRSVINTTVTSVAGALTYKSLFINSLFSPLFGSSGLYQPNRFDQMTVFYKRYCVLSAKVSATVFGDIGGQQPIVWGLSRSDDYTLVNNTWPNMIESARGPHTLQNPNLNSPPKKLNIDWNARSHFGIRNVNERQNISSEVSTNPAEGAYINFWFQSKDMVTSSATHTVAIVIDFVVQFSEQNSVLTS